MRTPTESAIKFGRPGGRGGTGKRRPWFYMVGGVVAILAVVYLRRGLEPVSHHRPADVKEALIDYRRIEVPLGRRFERFGRLARAMAADVEKGGRYDRRQIIELCGQPDSTTAWGNHTQMAYFYSTQRSGGSAAVFLIAADGTVLDVSMMPQAWARRFVGTASAPSATVPATRASGD